MANSVTQQLERIEKDILYVLECNGSQSNDSNSIAMTENDLYSSPYSRLNNISSYGWRFALENLEKKKLIVSDPTMKNWAGYKLTTQETREEVRERDNYENEIENYVGQKAILEHYINSFATSKKRKLTTIKDE